jgi:hypothetical protein
MMEIFGVLSCCNELHYNIAEEAAATAGGRFRAESYEELDAHDDGRARHLSVDGPRGKDLL